MSRLFTVLLPITRPPLLLPFAIESVLEQSVTDFEVLVICDGAPPETVACAKAFASRDSRVKVFPFPKGARHGEAYRDCVLSTASGRNIAQICDDDLWLPNHLEEMELLLSNVDFGNLLHVHVGQHGSIKIFPGDLARSEIRQRMLQELHNFFGLSFVGYRMAAYQHLPERWSPAPPDVWTDLFMWRKFLAVDGMKFGTRAAVTALHFAAPERANATLEERQNENRKFLDRIRDPIARNEIVELAWHSLLNDALEAKAAATTMAAEHSRAQLEINAIQKELALVAASRDELVEQLALVTKSRDVFEAEAERLSQRLKAKEHEVRLVLGSKSWRLTSPFRKLAAKVTPRRH